jgi:hypothetical protein
LAAQSPIAGILHRKAALLSGAVRTKTLKVSSLPEFRKVLGKIAKS